MVFCNPPFGVSLLFLSAKITKAAHPKSQRKTSRVPGRHDEGLHPDYQIKGRTYETLCPVLAYGLAMF